MEHPENSAEYKGLTVNSGVAQPSIVNPYLKRGRYRHRQMSAGDYVEGILKGDVTILGRSFVTLEYQSTRQGSKGLFTLDNLWDGLGALTVLVPDVRYYFGKMTMYPSYNRYGRDMILYFLKKHFEDKDRLIVPIHPLQLEADTEELRKLFVYEDFKEDYKILNSEVRKLGYNIPPLVNAYMGLSPTMKMFGTAINDEFGDVEETGILIAVDEIREEKRRRHIETFSGRG